MYFFKCILYNDCFIFKLCCHIATRIHAYIQTLECIQANICIYLYMHIFLNCTHTNTHWYAYTEKKLLCDAHFNSLSKAQTNIRIYKKHTNKHLATSIHTLYPTHVHKYVRSTYKHFKQMLLEHCTFATALHTCLFVWLCMYMCVCVCVCCSSEHPLSMLASIFFAFPCTEHKVNMYFIHS